jgi:hypothetical protein
MKLFGVTLLIVGFLWIAWDAIEGFNVYQHSRWVWQSQHLPEGEMIKRADAVTALRELSLALKNTHIQVAGFHSALEAPWARHLCRTHPPKTPSSVGAAYFRSCRSSGA